MREDKPETLVDWVAERLEGWVLDGSVRPGARLPSEREMADRLKVSRVTVRESLRRLEARGLVVAGARRGTYVSLLGPTESLDALALLALAVREPGLRHRLFRGLLELRRHLVADLLGLASEQVRLREWLVEGCREVAGHARYEPQAAVVRRAELDFLREVARHVDSLGFLFAFGSLQRLFELAGPQLMPLLPRDAIVQRMERAAGLVEAGDADVLRRHLLAALAAEDTWLLARAAPVRAEAEAGPER